MFTPLLFLAPLQRNPDDEPATG